MPQTVHILMGSNLGDRERNLTRAREKLELIPGLEITAASSVYITQPQDMEGENPSFLNQVIQADYQYRPHELLNGLERIEKGLGRTGKGEKTPRTIDLDILLFGDEIIEDGQLSIPHRDLLNRPFAMVPLLQIDPSLRHPVTGTPIADFLGEYDENSIVLYKDYVERHI